MLAYLAAIESKEQKDRFEQLYLLHRHTMLHVAYGIVGDSALAEDVVHSAFLKIIDILDKFEDLHSSKARNLIVTIVKNKAIDMLRKDRRTQSLPPEEMEEAFAATGGNPSDCVIDREGYECLLACITQLEESYKCILELRYFHEMSAKEIARVLDIKEKNAQIRLYRAKKKLRTLLVKEGIAHG